MKPMGVILLFSTLFAVSWLISFYIFIRGLQSIPPGSTLRHAYAIAFWIVALSFMCGRLLEKIWPSALTDFFIWTGSFWLAAMLYLLMAAVLLDLLRLINSCIPIFPAIVRENYTLVKSIVSVTVLGATGLLLLGGYLNTLIPRIQKLNLTVAGKSTRIKSLNIVAVSDIHLGTIVGRSQFDSIVNKINSLNPDLVLLPGDIVDEDLAPVIRQNAGESLGKIKSRLGTYAITGNHEYIGGVEKACAYLEDHHITMLRDRSVKIADSFYLVGREDRSMSYFAGRRRKGLDSLMAGVDRAYPVILMDHQPFNLEEAAGQEVDLQISGHTHDAQLWPMHYIVKAIYEVAWGYKRIGRTHFYISDGVGTWGPPVRIGNRPEIVQINLNFE